MKTIESFLNISQHQGLTYIPIIAFFALLLIGFVLGLMKKVTASTVTFVTAIVSILISIFTFDIAFKQFNETFKEYTQNSGLKEEDFKPLLYTIYAISVFVLLEIVTGFVYFIVWLFFLRKVFRRQKATQSFKKSLALRLSGSLISTIAIFPLALFVSNATTLFVNKEDNFNKKFLSPSIKVLSKNQAITYAGKLKSFNYLLSLTKSNGIQKVFSSIAINKSFIDGEKISDEDKAKFEYILNDDFTSNLLVPVFAKAAGDNKLDRNTIELNDRNRAIIEENIKSKNLVMKQLNETGKKSLKNFLVKSFINDDLKEKYENKDPEVVKLVDNYANFLITALTNSSKEN
ncbi:hypothetical protein [Mycoplasma zalophi]|uniref:CvpA family protein n=1 Tax=Mycoplasma zalophi TaxID=191287 RepID=A0ABS6DPL0_9MOLU|nr:hypothetical protein [Mycoplasma zalophi]MBU4690962.1 hypothetical protein [Mycoplasma zalophi]MBU4692259.1 hypothetical protein [Mycoplasma zalophi]